MSSSAFGGVQSTASSSTSLFPSAKPAAAGFSFAQPTALPGAQQPTASTSSIAPTSGLQFTFSQPATPSSSSNKTTSSVNEPTTPSSFSFTSKTLQAQPRSLFGPSKFGQSFGEVKDKATDDKESSAEPTVETNVFARLGKAPKRKEEAPGLSTIVEGHRRRQ
ncbi:hypothetical protein WMY93_031416 [Mugilogobius chulae]|uniref:Uncharacterized protein n=1 Tax=Mugilogobius chulae TaxID=88201 RepID=A0AAW0ME82_9GOBI